MTDAAPAIFVAIEGSAFAAAMRQSPYAYMAANVAHILSLMVFFGAVAVMDLRLAGFFQATWPGSMLRRARLVAILGFARAGGCPARCCSWRKQATSFSIRCSRSRLALIALGLDQHHLVRIFHRPKVRDLQPHTPLPGSARFVGVIVDRDLARGRGLRTADRVFLGISRASPRPADRDPVHAQRRLADADRHALPVLAAGADAAIEREIVADHA